MPRGRLAYDVILYSAPRRLIRILTPSFRDEKREKNENLRRQTERAREGRTLIRQGEITKSRAANAILLPEKSCTLWPVLSDKPFFFFLLCHTYVRKTLSQSHRERVRVIVQRADFNFEWTDVQFLAYTSTCIRIHLCARDIFFISERNVH